MKMPSILRAGLLSMALGPFASAAIAQNAAKPGTAVTSPAGTPPATAAPAPAVAPLAATPVSAEPAPPPPVSATGYCAASGSARAIPGRASARWPRRCRRKARRRRSRRSRSAAWAGEPLRITIVLPSDLSFPSSVQVSANNATPLLDLAWRRCLPGGCFADAVARDDVLKRWRGLTEPGRIVFKSAAGRDVAILLSFRGLAFALDALAKERA